MQIIVKTKESLEHTVGRLSAQAEIANKIVNKKLNDSQLKILDVNSTAGDNAGGIDELAELVAELIEAIDDLANVISDIMEG